MRQPSAYGSSIAIALLCVSLIALPACSPRLTRPIALQSPPSVPCDSPSLAVPPMVPEPSQMDVWAIRMLGLYEIAATHASAVNGCLRELRAKGVIR